MALQYVGGLTTGFNGVTPTGTTTTVALAGNLSGGLATSPAIGDTVIVAYAVNSNIDRRADLTIASGDGFTYTQISSLFSGAASAAETSLRVAYLTLTTANTSLVLGLPGNATGAGLTVSVHVWRGVDTANPIDVTPVTGTFGTGGVTPNLSFSAITPVTSGAVIIAAGAGGGTSVVYASTDLSNFRTVRQTNTYQSVNGIGSRAWSGSGSYTPATWTGGSSGYTSGSYAWSLFALRPAGTTRTLNPSLVTDSEVFYGPTVAPGAVGLSPSLLANTQTFYGPSVTKGAVSLTHSLLTNSQAFYAPAVGRGAVSLQPPLLANTQAFYGPSVTPGAVTLLPPLVSNTQTFYGPVVSGGGAVTLSPPLLSNAQSFYAASVAPGAVSLQPALLTNTQTFYAPAASGGAATLSPPLLSNSQSFFATAVAAGAVTVAPALLTNVSAVFAPTVSQSAITLQPSVVGPTSSIFAPTVQTGALTIAPQRLDNTSAVYSPVATSVSTLAPGLLTTFNSFFGSTISTGATVLSPPLLASGSKIFVPSIGDKFSDIYRLLANRQELDPAAGKFRVYADDGVTIFMEADAWEDAAGTIRFRGVGLARIDRLMPYAQ